MNDLEKAKQPLVDGLALVTGIGVPTDAKIERLAILAYIRALLRGVPIPQRTPRPDAELFRDVYQRRAIPDGVFVQIGVCTQYVFSAGSIDVARNDDGYLMPFGVGIEALIVSVDIGTGSALEVARELYELPRKWFPGSLHSLWPAESFAETTTLKPLSAEQGAVYVSSFAIPAVPHCFFLLTMCSTHMQLFLHNFTP